MQIEWTSNRDKKKKGFWIVVDGNCEIWFWKSECGMLQRRIDSTSGVSQFQFNRINWSRNYVVSEFEISGWNINTRRF